MSNLDRDGLDGCKADAMTPEARRSDSCVFLQRELADCVAVWRDERLNRDALNVGTRGAPQHGMEPSVEYSEKTLAKARKEAATANVEKGMHRLKKGVTRFVSHNQGVVGGVTFGAVGLIATGLAVNRLPVRKAFRRYRRRARTNSTLSTTALMGAGAILGTGLTILLAPRWLRRD